MHIEKMINPMTGEIFKKDEYYAFRDTILTYGLSDEENEIVERNAERMGLKTFKTDCYTDVYGIPYFCIVIDPTQSTLEELEGFVELWEESRGLEIFLTKPLPENLVIPSRKVSLLQDLRVSPELFRYKLVKAKVAMEKRVNMKDKVTDRIVRLLKILKRLKRGKFCKTSDFAQELGVTTRTVQRDLALLDEIGEPIGYDTNQKAYFLLMDESFLWDEGK